MEFSYIGNIYRTRINSNQIWVLPPNSSQFWGQKWISICSTNWNLIDAQACGMGPVFVLKNRQGNHYLIKGIHFQNTNLLWSKSSSKIEPKILAKKKYGIEFKIGNAYYNTVNNILNGPFSS